MSGEGLRRDGKTSQRCSPDEARILHLGAGGKRKVQTVRRIGDEGRGDYNPPERGLVYLTIDWIN